eukprot:Pgem_evm1s8274
MHIKSFEVEDFVNGMTSEACEKDFLHESVLKTIKEDTLITCFTTLCHDINNRTDRLIQIHKN